jgi:HlyD family secretion protein
MRRRLLIIVLLLSAISLGAGGWKLMSVSRRPVREDLVRVPVRRADFDVTLAAPGKVDSSEKTLVECELENIANTTILELIDEGTRVRRNDVLCRLDASDYEEYVRLQEIGVQQAKSDFEKADLDVKASEIALIEYRDGVLPQLLEALDGQIIMGQSEVTRQSDRLEWTQQLLKKGYLPEGQVTAEADKMFRAEVALTNFKGERRMLSKHTSPATILRLEVAVLQAKTTRLFEGLRLERSKELLKKYRQQVEQCTIRAPHDGFVIYANFGGPKIELGMRVFQKMKLFYLPNLEKMEIQTVLNESVVTRVHKNMRAKVMVEGVPEYPVEGTVVTVAQVQVPGDILTILGLKDIRSYECVIHLDKPPPKLFPGMTADVRFLVGHHVQKLVVPVEVVLSDHGRSYCYVDGREGLERREIRLGEGTRDLLEVQSGLNEGEQVIRNPSRLAEDEIELATANGKNLDDAPTESHTK